MTESPCRSHSGSTVTGVRISTCGRGIVPKGVFTSVGIDPRHKRYLLLKSRIHYRAGFAPLARATITCDGEGVTTSDNDLLRFEHVRRPVFPLDRLNAPLDRRR